MLADMSAILLKSEGEEWIRKRMGGVGKPVRGIKTRKQEN